MKADLHLHTTASDGQYTPEELIALAREKGLQALAVTDHDTIAGVDRAREAGKAAGLYLIRGVELSAREHHNFHLLGYGFAPDAEELAQLCEKLRASREERSYQILTFLEQQGIKLSLEKVQALAGGDVIAKPHFAQALVQEGYAETVQDAFRRYLDTPAFRQKVKRFKADARTCIQTVKAGGGVVSLAHPYQMGLPDSQLEALVSQLKDWGLDAIECFYPKYTPEQQAFYLYLAEKYRLHSTGGSDFHGEKVKPDISLACLELDLSWIPA